MAGLKILLTGSTGFVGRTLLLDLLQTKHYSEIHLPVRSPEKIKKILQEEGYSEIPIEIKFHKAEAPLWQGIADTEVDHLVHCAGTLFAHTKEEFFSTNVDGTLNLFEKVHFHRAVVVSSQAATGPCVGEESERDEDSADCPLTWYGKSKLEMERRLLEKYSSREYVCLRPPMVLGPRDQATLPLFKLAKGPVLVKPGLKTKFYSYIAVSDLAAAIQSALAYQGGFQTLGYRSFYVASSELISDEQLMRTASKVSGKKGRLLSIPQTVLKGVAFAMNTIPGLKDLIPSLSGDRAQEVWADRWVVSPRRFESLFGWKAKASFESTLQETRDWYLKTGQLN